MDSQMYSHLRCQLTSNLEGLLTFFLSSSRLLSASFSHWAATCSLRDLPTCCSITFTSSQRWMEPRRTIDDGLSTSGKLLIVCEMIIIIKIVFSGCESNINKDISAVYFLSVLKLDYDLNYILNVGSGVSMTPSACPEFLGSNPKETYSWVGTEGWSMSAYKDDQRNRLYFQKHF